MHEYEDILRMHSSSDTSSSIVVAKRKPSQCRRQCVSQWVAWWEASVILWRCVRLTAWAFSSVKLWHVKEIWLLCSNLSRTLSLSPLHSHFTPSLVTVGTAEQSPEPTWDVLNCISSGLLRTHTHTPAGWIVIFSLCVWTVCVCVLTLVRLVGSVILP